MDVAIEQAISRVTITDEARSSLKDLIANIIAEEPAATKSASATTQQTPSIAHRLYSKHKGAQPFRGATTPEESKHKRTRPTQPKAT